MRRASREGPARLECHHSGDRSNLRAAMSRFVGVVSADNRLVYSHFETAAVGAAVIQRNSL